MQILSVYLRFLLVLFGFLAIACQRNDSDEIENSGNHSPETLYYHDIQLIGRIKNSNDEALEGASISCNQLISTTDKEGLFLLRNLKSNKAGQLVRFSHANFYDEYRFFVTDEGDVQSQIIRLAKLEDAITFEDKDGKVVSLNEHIKINVPAASFITSTGENYTGRVNLYIRKIQSLSFMPVEGLNFEKKIFDDAHTFQILAFTDNNEKLLLKNKVKVVSTPGLIVAGLDEARALWKEEKSLTTDGQTYTEIDHLNLISIGRLTNFAFIEATLNNDNGNVLSNVTLTMETGDNVGEIHSSQSGKIRCFFPSNVTTTLSYITNTGSNVPVASYNLPKGKHKVESLTLKTNGPSEIFSKLKLCGNGELSDEDMVSLLITSYGKDDLILFQTEKEKSFYTANEYSEVKATYFSNGNQIYSISKNTIEAQIIEISNDNFCISDLIGYLNVDGEVKYFNENQISILKETNNSISITDNIGFILNIENPKINIPLNPSVLLISNPKNIVCDENNCMNMVATFAEVSSVGSKVKLTLKGSSGGYAIEGSFEGILK